MKTALSQQNIPSGWQKTFLEFLATKLKTGGTPTSTNKNFYGGSIPFVKIDDMTTSRKHLSSTLNFISDEGLKNSSAWLVPKGSILYSIYATVGEVSINSIDVATNQAIMGIIVNEEVADRDYLYQYLLSIKHTLKKHFKETTQKNLTSQIVKELEVLLPKSKTEQQKIAEILGGVDEDIAKTQKVIGATEKLKRGLMQQLFTRGIEHAKFKETKLGEIPEEWEVVRLEEIANVERGKFSHRPRNAPEFYGGAYPFIQTGDVIKPGGKISKYTQTLNDLGLSVSRLFPKGTIVMTIAANIGDTGILNFDSCFPDSLVGITANKKTSNVFLEYMLQTKKEYLNSIATQSAQKNINLEKLQPMLVVKPKIEEQQKIAEILSAVDEKISVNKKLKEKLTLLKKGLMQDLLSGKVRTK